MSETVLQPTFHLALTAIIAATLIPLGACSERAEPNAPQPSESHAVGDRTSEPTTSQSASAPHPAQDAAAPTDAPELTERDCLLVVDGVTHVSGRCLVYPMGDGGFTLNVWSRGKPTQSHFAVVSVNGQAPAEASWNKDPDDSHAWDTLGPVVLENGCWVNTRTKICAR